MRSVKHVAPFVVTLAILAGCETQQRVVTQAQQPATTQNEEPVAAHSQPPVTTQILHAETPEEMQWRRLQERGRAEAAWREDFNTRLESASSLETFAVLLKEAKGHGQQWCAKVSLTRRQWYCKTNATVPGNIRDAILRESLIPGMTPEQVRVTWGEPSHVSRSGGLYGIHEQWEYRWVGKTTFLYFENGVMTSWQEM